MENNTRFYVWTNELTFTKPRILTASGECELLDTLYLSRLELGLSEDEAMELCENDTFEEASYNG